MCSCVHVGPAYFESWTSIACLSRNVSRHSIYISSWFKYLWMEIVWSKPCPHLWTWSTESPYSSTISWGKDQHRHIYYTKQYQNRIQQNKNLQGTIIRRSLKVELCQRLWEERWLFCIYIQMYVYMSVCMLYFSMYISNALFIILQIWWCYLISREG